MSGKDLENTIDDEEMDKYAKEHGIDTSIPDFLNKESLEDNTDIDIRFRKFDNEERSKSIIKILKS